MFAYLSGKLVEKSPMNVIIDCSGVGYDVEIPLSTHDKLGEINSLTKLFIHFAMNDDGIRLFGFYSINEKLLFRMLIGISRIGPKIALSILSALSISSFVEAVKSDNSGLITTVPGLGKKSAQRLIIELRDKVDNLSNVTNSIANQPFEISILNESEQALLTLGYKLPEIRKTLQILQKENVCNTTEDFIKSTIKYLYKKSKI